MLSGPVQKGLFPHAFDGLQRPMAAALIASLASVCLIDAPRQLRRGDAAQVAANAATVVTIDATTDPLVSRNSHSRISASSKTCW